MQRAPDTEEARDTASNALLGPAERGIGGDPGARVTGEFSTLIDPRRDVDPTRVHGNDVVSIDGADLLPSHVTPVSSSGPKDHCQPLGMARRHDPGRAQLRPYKVGEVPVLEVGEVPGGPDLAGRNREWINFNDQCGSHER